MERLKKLGIKIPQSEILNSSLTHSSYANEHGGDDYEKLEFLGDAVLQIVISEYLYQNSSSNEGDMSKTRARYVCEQALACYSKQIGLDKLILVGEGQKNNLTDTIIADVFESFLGAIYLSNGLEDAKKIIYDIIVPYIKQNHDFYSDYKSLLQEMVQTTKQSLEYIVIKESGPAHNKNFEIIVKIDEITYGRGFGKSKKEAEQNAAFDAYKKSAS